MATGPRAAVNRRAVPAFMMIPEIGWLTSCAMEAVEPACCRRTFAFGDEKPERRAGAPSFRIESLDVSLGRGGVEMSLKKEASSST